MEALVENQIEALDALFFCNPLLDIVVHDNDETKLMSKYKLEHKMACLASPE